MSTRKKLLFVLVIIAAFAGMAVPALSATSWKTKATVISQGRSWYTTESWVSTVVPRPYAVRVGFRTPAGAKTVAFDYSVFCENSSRTEDNRKVTTPSDGTWKWVTVQPGSAGLGAFCDVFVTSRMNNTARLDVKIQAKHP